MDGWMDGWMDRAGKDCLQQSKMLEIEYLNHCFFAIIFLLHTRSLFWIEYEKVFSCLKVCVQVIKPIDVVKKIEFELAH